MNEISEVIKSASWTLASKPILWGWASIGTGAVSFIGWVMPYLQFISITLGICIGLLTLYGMIEKRFNNK